jgi:hypothetical protein
MCKHFLMKGISVLHCTSYDTNNMLRLMGTFDRINLLQKR